MKLIRITIALMIPAALMAISVGAHAASIDQAANVAVVLPASFCESFDELLSTGGVVEPDAELSSINIEIFAAPRRSPVSPWLLLDPIAVSLFTCDGGGASTLSQDLASAP